MYSAKEIDLMVGKRIREVREDTGLSQNDLGRLIGYKTRASVSRIEKGEISISVSNLYLISVRLGINLMDLIPEELKS